MMLAEISEQGIALWVMAAGAVVTAIFGAYSYYRKTMRQEKAADDEARLKEKTDDATFWQKQYETKCASDLQWQARVSEKLEQVEKRHAKLEEEYFQCQQEHAQARGQMASMLRDLESKDKRIAELERLVGKI